jgi:ABC-type transporter Mla MlaB component
MKQRKGARKTGSSKRSTPSGASARKTVRVVRAASPARSASASRAGKAARAGRAIALPEECLIASVPTLKAALLKRLGDGGSVKIDASSVQRIDSAGLQVLAAFARDRRAAGLAVEWLSVPESLAGAASLLSLTDALGLAAQPGSVVAA